MTTVIQDLRFALRQMRRSPGFALAAVFTLALAITANVVVFGVLQALILRPIDVPQAEKVMTLARKDQPYPFFSYPEVRDVRDGNSVFSAVAAVMIENFGLDANGSTRPVWGAEVSGQYFEVVAIRPFLGRLLNRADDDHPGASESAVLSWPAWKNDFNGDPTVVGRTVRINKHPYTIVGVTPEGFYGTEKMGQLDIFVPMANEASLEEDDWLEARGRANAYGVVRIKDGVTMPQVQADLDTIAARSKQLYPKEEERLTYKVVRPGLMGDFFGAPARSFLAGVLGLAGIVLLAACANLGGLFAARTADRTREIAIRMAVGSSRWRVVRQILSEAVLIAIFGGAFACGLAWMALSGLARWRPPSEYPVKFFAIQPQPSLIVIGLLISVFAGVAFGVMPLRQIFKTDPNDAIKNGGNQSSSSSSMGRRWALRDVLLAAQVALCCVTVTAAFVSLRGLGRAMTMNMGINPQHAVLTRFELNQAGYTDVTSDQFQRQLLERVSHLPGVETAAYGTTTPLSMDTDESDVFTQQTTDFRSSNRASDTYNYWVSPGYFVAAGTPLLAGRDLSFDDTAKSPAVAVVNEEFARRLFQLDHAHSGEAVGRYFKNGSGQSVQVVGVVADGKYFSLTEDQEVVTFHPILQGTTGHTSFLVRLRADSPDVAAIEMAGTMQRVIRDLDPAVPIRVCAPWKSTLGMTYFVAQVATVALGLFGAFGLLLSITGTFGLASYSVSKRLRELSIRVALGAQARQVLSAALGRMMILLASGSVVGMLLGVGASRVLSAIVYQASAQDPFVLGAVAVTVLVTGSLSVAGPVRRALRIDPANVLREQ
jgi:predicted permease